MKLQARTLALFAVTSIAAAAVADGDELHELPTGLSPIAGQVVYSVTDSGKTLVVIGSISGPGSAFVFDGHALTPITLNAGDFVYAMNSSTAVTGTGANGAFYQSPTGAQTLISNATGDSFYPFGISDHNVVVGQAYGASIYGFFWDAGNVTSYNPPGGSQATITYLDRHGDFVGYAYNLTTFDLEPFKVVNGTATWLTVPGLTNVSPTGINHHGEIAGFGSTALPNTYGSFVITHGGQVVPVSFESRAPAAMPGPKAPLPLQRGTTSTTLWSLNDFGWVGGQFSGYYIDPSVAITVWLPIAGRPLDDH